MKTLTKIDKFYLVLGLVLLVMALIVIFTLRTIFSSLEIAEEVNDELFQASTPRINRTQLEKALSIMNEGKVIPLDL